MEGKYANISKWTSALKHH